MATKSLFVHAFYTVALLTPLGCARQNVPAIPDGWPYEIQGRQLYNTPRALVYATTTASASWTERYLRERLSVIEKRFQMSVGRGVVIAVAPDDPPIEGIACWPKLPEDEKTLLYYGLPTEVDHTVLGLPGSFSESYGWLCILPTDGFYEAAVERYQHASLRAVRERPLGERMQALMWALFLFPQQKAYYLKRADARREQVLATLAIERIRAAGTERDALIERVRQFYVSRMKQIEQRCPKD